MHVPFEKSDSPMDWVPIIRKYLFDALENKIDMVNFIPGKGIHSKNQFCAVLRPLTIMAIEKLGFKYFVNRHNKGVVVADISSYHKMEEPGDKKDDDIDDKDEDDDKDDDDNDKDDKDDDVENILFKTIELYGVGKDTTPYKDIDYKDIDINTFKKIKSRFPYINDICIKIICTRRSEEQAIKYVEEFEKCVNENKFQDDKERKLTEEMNCVKYFKEKYEIDQIIIEKIVHEKITRGKIKKVLDRITNEVPDDFYDHFSEFVMDYNSIGIDNLLNVMKKGKYDIDQIKNSMITNSLVVESKTKNLLNIQDFVNKNRKNNNNDLPAVIPSIEIDLTNAGYEKARRFLTRVLNDLESCSISEIDFKCNKDEELGFCTTKQIVDFMNQMIKKNGYNLKSIEMPYKKEYNNFFIKRKNKDMVEEEDDDDDYDSSIFYKSFKRIPI